MDGTLVANRDDIATTKFLLSRGVRIISATTGVSANTHLSDGSNLEILRLLIAFVSEADLKASRDDLNYAAAYGKLDTLHLLLDLGFDVNAITIECGVGETPLIAACESYRKNQFA